LIDSKIDKGKTKENRKEVKITQLLLDDTTWKVPKTLANTPK